MISDEEAGNIKEQLFSQIEKLPKEQVQSLKDKINSMNNEQLEQFVKQSSKASCVFCEIVKGNAKAFKIYEDKNFVAVLDIMPVSKGHTLIIPRKHVQSLNQLSDEESKEIFALAKKIIPVIIKVTKAKAVDLHAPQGEQRVPHLALNLIPKYEKEKEEQEEQEKGEGKKKQVSEQELQELSDKLSFELSKIKKSGEEKQKKEQEKKEKKEKEEKQEQEESEAQKLMKHIQERIP